MKKIPKSGIKVFLPASDSWWIGIEIGRLGGEPYRIFSEEQAKKLLRIEVEIKKLIKITEQAIEHYDTLMKQPESLQRGKDLATVTNAFEIAKDCVKNRLGMKLKRLK